MAPGTNLEFNHLVHRPYWGKNLLMFYLSRIIDLDTARIKWYHMSCHNHPGQSFERFLDFVTGLD